MERDKLIQEAEDNFRQYIREITSGNEFTRLFGGFTKMALETNLTKLFEMSIKNWIKDTMDKIMSKKLEEYVNSFFARGKADRKIQAYIDKQLTKSYWFKGTKTVQEFCEKESKKYFDKFGEKIEEYLNTQEGMSEMLEEIAESVTGYYYGF